MAKRTPMTEVADRINAHLKRFEADPKINEPDERGLCDYYNAQATYGGARIHICYISYQRAKGSSRLTRDQAEKYLAWLDAGNIGRHYKAIKDAH